MNRATILAGLGGGALALLLLAPATGTALGRMAEARAARAAAIASLSAPDRADAALLSPGLRAPGGGADAAADTLVAHIRTRAAAGGVLVEQVERGPAGPGLVGLRLRLSGPDKAVVALVDGLERDRPLLRFSAWQVEALAGGALRLHGDVVAAWR
ncbi:hypothetical protein [Sphingomonas sp.]|uniref:hypothetical protein n=1 Tax=Sphingomonas sp. TaxID=28214 RepID=UPI001ED271D6|nr:hypothetical protein [Sphingomonas sp.]MBX3594187.1 hypothetical protein [Sphingomonas sp.]